MLALNDSKSYALKHVVCAKEKEQADAIKKPGTSVKKCSKITSTAMVIFTPQCN